MRKTKFMYAMRPGAREGHYICTKLTPDYEEKATYHLSEAMVMGQRRVECPCFAGSRATCRHRQMLDKFQAFDRIGKGWLLDHDNDRWIEPATEEDE